MPTSPESPHWNFEAFRNFIGFAPLQQACTSLLVHDGITLDKADIELRHINNLLADRTGREWTPDRDPGGNVQWETEGSLFRNKKRVFTSFYLIDAEKYERENILMLTPFGRALADGRVTEPEFYRFIIRNFKFPHPAYEDNWKWWTSVHRELHPLVFLLLIVCNLSGLSGSIESVSIAEVAYFGGPNPSTRDAENIARAIKNSRDSRETINHQRSDALDRKIGDMFAFLAMTPWASMRGRLLTLNPIRKDPITSGSNWLDLDEINTEINELIGEIYDK